jgi:hypothetical protein
MAEQIPPQIVSIALEHATGNAFEDFVGPFMASLSGVEYVPLGGTADGGADGVYEYPEAHERPGHFLQASIETDVEGKIRRTVKRLLEVGRSPTSLTYVTPKRVPKLDLVEQALSDELGVAIRIRDGVYVATHTNDSPQSQAAFHAHLAPFVEFLRHVGAATPVHVTSRHVKDVSAYVFLRQELDRRSGNDSLVDATVDALILWALEGTDPDAGKLMSRGEIAAKIAATLPAVKSILDAKLDERVEAMASKSYDSGRSVRWHKSEDVFALPFEARLRVAEANAEDEALRLAILDEFRTVASELLPDSPEGLWDAAGRVALRAVEVLFENEGIEFAEFISGVESGDAWQPLTYVSDAVAIALQQMDVASVNREAVGDAVLEILRRAFYSSTVTDRAYLGKLSRTFALLFSLEADIRVVEYFEGLTGDFQLFVGTDVLVRAMSERYLAPEDQMTRNMLALAREAGASLILAEPVLEEVVTHLRATDLEYKNVIEPVAGHINLDMARNSPQILIRAYFYASLDPGRSKPGSWELFVRQFCDPAALHKPAGYDAIRGYLENTFGLRFESRKDLEGLVDPTKVEQIADELQGNKARRVLAENDALMALAVYGRRDAAGEHSAGSEFGLKTWWLTGEANILRYTGKVVEEHHGERYMMRPEFMLNFLALAPSAAEVRRTYGNVLPSILGLQLAQRMGTDDFRQLMGEVRAATELEEGRREAEMGSIVDRLKGDFRRQYVRTIEDERSTRLPEPEDDVL